MRSLLILAFICASAAATPCLAGSMSFKDGQPFTYMKDYAARTQGTRVCKSASVGECLSLQGGVMDVTTADHQVLHCTGHIAGQDDGTAPYFGCRIEHPAVFKDRNGVARRCTRSVILDGGGQVKNCEE